MNNEIDVIENIKQACELLNTVDEYLETLPNKHSICDSSRHDLMHTIENKPEDIWNYDNMHNVFDEIRRISIERRKVKIDLNLTKVYQDNIGKLNNPSNRAMLLEKLYKTYKNCNEEYKYRVYSEDQINTLLGTTIQEENHIVEDNDLE